MRKTLAAAALVVAATLAAPAAAHANPSGIPNPGTSDRVTQVETKEVHTYPWPCRIATRERIGVKTPLGEVHWNAWSTWRISGFCVVDSFTV